MKVKFTIEEICENTYEFEFDEFNIKDYERVKKLCLDHIHENFLIESINKPLRLIPSSVSYKK